MLERRLVAGRLHPAVITLVLASVAIATAMSVAMPLVDRITRFGRHFRSVPAWAAVLLVAGMSLAARKRQRPQR